MNPPWRLTTLGLTGVLVAWWVLGFDLDPVPLGVDPAADLAAAAPMVGVTHDGAGAAEELRRKITAREKELRAGVPRRYVVVDRANNRLYLRSADTVELEAVVSTGSGAILLESSGQRRTWVFDTPPGRFAITSERPNPVWTKPDWAFLEVGELPPRSVADRREPGVLGEWALDLKDGYMIHGTLYERLLGRGVTHGCIRVGRDDLRRLAAAVRPGTRVYIY